MAITVLNGHDMSGTTAQRPTNADLGHPYYDTTLGRQLTYGSTGWETAGGEAAAALGAGTVVSKSGLSLAESGNGAMHKTVFTFTAMTIAMADNAGTIAYGSQKLYDFPAGVIEIDGVVADIDLTKSSAGIEDTWDGDFSIGTAAANNGATLVGTEADILVSTATPQAADGATTANASTLTAITVLTDNSAGTANSTVQALSDGSTYANDVAAIRNNFADLSAKINEILAAFTGAKKTTLDGTATAKDLYINFLIDDDDHDVTGTAANLILNGTLTVHWKNLGDY